jgi:hypothetical protein
MNTKFKYITVDWVFHFLKRRLNSPGSLKVDGVKPEGFWALFLFRTSLMWDDVFLILGMEEVLAYVLGAARLRRLPENEILFGVSLFF